MFLKRRLAAFASIVATVAVGAPVALASPATMPVASPVITGPSCPAWYAGPTNLATGCPYWLMTYTVEYPGQRSWRCPTGWSPPPASQGMGAARAPRAAVASAGPVLNGCSVVPTAS